MLHVLKSFPLPVAAYSVGPELCPHPLELRAEMLEKETSENRKK